MPLSPQSMVLRPAALASPGSLVDMCRSEKKKKKKQIYEIKQYAFGTLKKKNLTIVKSNCNQLKLNIEMRGGCFALISVMVNFMYHLEEYF